MKVRERATVELKVEVWRAKM